jgi:hypothetical protein
MYLTLQRRTGLWLCLEKRIVGVKNAFVMGKICEITQITSKETRISQPPIGLFFFMLASE